MNLEGGAPVEGLNLASDPDRLEELDVGPEDVLVQKGHVEVGDDVADGR